MVIATSNETLKLTQTVQKGGCAAKVPGIELRKILSQVRFPHPPANLIVGAGSFDDSAVLKVSDTLALVQTLDFFTPIVDSPKLFGKIAAANALSDVYAMGGEPKTAMGILAFPSATLDYGLAAEVLNGACEVLCEADVPLVGGHSIDDETLKFGLSVTGFVNPNKIWTNSGSREGDCLILTKPLGTGTVCAALKKGFVDEFEMKEVTDSMCRLNKMPFEFLEKFGSDIHAATDVTGFGLAGHATHMARESGLTFQIYSKSLPVFELSKRCLQNEFLTRAHRTNREYVALTTRFLEGENATFSNLICCDPQTSGGLLLSVEPKKATKILESLKTNFADAAIVGEVVKRNDKQLEFINAFYEVH